MDPLSNALPPAAGPASLTGSYHDFNGLGKLKGQARTDAKSAMRETAQQFEAMFLQQMMKSMRDASFKSDLVESNGKETFEAMFDKEVSMGMARRNSIGPGGPAGQAHAGPSGPSQYCGTVESTRHPWHVAAPCP